MRLRVEYTAQLRTVLGRSEEEIDLPEGSSLAELLVHLASVVCREAAPHLLTAAGMQSSLLVAVNKAAVPAREAGGVSIQAGDVVTLLPPIAGG
jgi:sulfur-carrier protein